MADLTDAQFAAFIDRIVACRDAEDAAKEDTKAVYAELADAGGDKTAAGLLVRTLRMDEKKASKAQMREALVDEYHDRYRRGKASHVRVREASQSYAEQKGRSFVASLTEEQKAEALAYRGDDTHGELTDTVEALREVTRRYGTNFDGYDAETRTFPAERELTDTQEQPETAAQSVPVDSRLSSLPAAREADESAAPHSNPPAESSQDMADKTGEAVPPPSVSPVALSDDDFDPSKLSFLSKDKSGSEPSEKSGCLKLKDGHCRINFATSALCSDCRQVEMKQRAQA